MGESVANSIRLRNSLHGTPSHFLLRVVSSGAGPLPSHANVCDRSILLSVKTSRQTWIAIGILAGVFLFGFLAGISSARPLKTVIPARSAAEDPKPEEFVQSFSSRMTESLNLSPEQEIEVEKHIRAMAEEIRSHQRSFIPKMTGAVTNAVDKILPLLDEQQQERLKRYRQATIERSPVRSIGRPPGPGFSPPTFRGPRNQGFGPPRTGTWGPPPGRRMDQQSSGDTNRPQRPPLE